jgi:hypothetical protein
LGFLHHIPEDLKPQQRRREGFKRALNTYLKLFEVL